MTDLEKYIKYFKKPLSIDDLVEILDSDTPDDEKVICIRGWLNRE